MTFGTCLGLIKGCFGGTDKGCSGGLTPAGTEKRALEAYRVNLALWCCTTVQGVRFKGFCVFSGPEGRRMEHPELIRESIPFTDFQPPPESRQLLRAEYQETFEKAYNELFAKFSVKGRMPGNDASMIIRMIELDESFHELVKFDAATGKVYFSAKYNSIDDVMNDIWMRAAMYKITLSPQTRRDIVQTILRRPLNTFNSIHLWVETMRRNKPEHCPLDDLLEWFDYSNPHDEPMYREFWDHFFRSVAVHIVSSYKGSPFPSEIVPILVGSQGIGKSRFCQYVATSPDYFVDLGNKQHALGSPDTLRMIAGKIVAELGEMSIWKKTDVESVKSFVTQVVDSWVPKYKEGVVEFKRSAFFMGNSNEERYLRDFSGNRRWFPVLIKEIREGLFERPDIMRRVWGWYLDLAVGVIDRGDYRSLQVPKRLHDFFEIKRNNAIDTGTDGDFLVQTVLRLEAEEMKTAPMAEWVYISPQEVARSYYGEASRAAYNFPKILAKVCKDLGYEISVNRRVNGVQTKHHRVPFAVARDREKEEDAPVVVPVKEIKAENPLGIF